MNWRADGGVLAIFAHPDDESILAGGVLAACAAAGERVSIVSMTRGEHGPSELGGRSALAEIRGGELLTAASALGASSVECLDYPDGGLAEADEDGATRTIASVVARERPSAIITFSEEGLYWHPDHVAVARLVARSLEGLGAEALVYGATWPRGHASALVAVLRERGLPHDLWSLDPGSFGAAQEATPVRIDVRRFLSAKLAAIRSHRTQIGRAHAFHALPEDVAERFLGFEYFVAASQEGWLAATVLRASAAS